MASLIKNRDKDKKITGYTIQLSPNEIKSRPRITLRGYTLKQARQAKTNIEHLIRSKNSGSPMVDWENVR